MALRFRRAFFLVVVSFDVGYGSLLHRVTPPKKAVLPLCRYTGRYSLRQLYTLQKRVRMW